MRYLRYLKVPSAWFSAYRISLLPQNCYFCAYLRTFYVSCAYLRTFYVNLTFCVKTVTLVPIYFVFLWNNYTFWIRFCLISYYYKRRLLIERSTPKSLHGRITYDIITWMPNSQRITMRLCPITSIPMLNTSIFIERGLIPNSQRITMPHFAKHYINRSSSDNRIHSICLELRSQVRKTISSTLLKSMQSWQDRKLGLLLPMKVTLRRSENSLSKFTSRNVDEKLSGRWFEHPPRREETRSLRPLVCWKIVLRRTQLLIYPRII